MASFHTFLLFCPLLFSLSAAQTPSRLKALVLRVYKDASTRQYYTLLAQRTPPVPIKLTIDLGGEYLWVDCDNGFNSSTKTTVPCRSPECKLSGTNVCSSNGIDEFCDVFPQNPFLSTGTTGEFSQDVLYIQSTNGRNPGRVARLRKFLFSCAPTFLAHNLLRNAVGMAGLGRNKVAMPSLFSAALGFPRKFALCLSSSTNSDDSGVAFFGDGPYFFLPGIDMSRSLTYTPLILNPVSTTPSRSHNGPSADYFIGVKSIKVNGKVVPLNTSLLSIDGRNGAGGTLISTVEPYTVLEPSIYEAVVGAFVKALPKNVARVSPKFPFETCFSTKNIASTRLGPSVPTIDLVLQNEKAVWSIYGTNSMVYVNDKVACLGFIGSPTTKTSIVIGGHQIENNLLQFDLANSRLGFSNTLNSRQTTCSNFNFTSTGNI